MNAAQLFISCLENEGVEYIFDIPGEENLHEVGTHSQLEIGVLGEISKTLTLIAEQAVPKNTVQTSSLREMIKAELDSHVEDSSFPLKPQLMRLVQSTLTKQASGLSDLLCNKSIKCQKAIIKYGIR